MVLKSMVMHKVYNTKYSFLPGASNILLDELLKAEEIDAPSYSKLNLSYLLYMWIPYINIICLLLWYIDSRVFLYKYVSDIFSEECNQFLVILLLFTGTYWIFINYKYTGGDINNDSNSN